MFLVRGRFMRVVLVNSCAIKIFAEEVSRKVRTGFPGENSSGDQRVLECGGFRGGRDVCVVAIEHHEVGHVFDSAMAAIKTTEKRRKNDAGGKVQESGST